MSYIDLLNECETVLASIEITEQQARNIEVSSRDQTQSKTQFQFRAGRVTASKFKAACHTDLTQPS